MLLFKNPIPLILTSGQSSNVSCDLFQINGELTLDEIQVRNSVMSWTDLMKHGSTSVPSWDMPTTMLGHFEGFLDAGNFPQGDKPVTGWRVLRRLYGTTQFYPIGWINDLSANIFYDITASANVKYEYAVQSESNGTYGNAVITQPIGPDGEPIEVISVDFFGWRLTSLDYVPDPITGTSYTFIVGNEIDDIGTNKARTEHTSSFAIFPKVEYGETKYRTGSLTTMPFDCVAGTYAFGKNSTRVALEAFLNNEEPKILKNGSGLCMVVDTFDVSIRYLTEVANDDYSQPYTVSFSFIEVATTEEAGVV